MSNDYDDNPDSKSCKITLIGSSGVGKTSIIRRYIDNNYNDDQVPTIGANFSQKILYLDDMEIKLNIWDTAGQERYISLGKHFYKDAYIVCLVYDITSRKSFDALKCIWYPDIKQNGEKYVVLAVVGNKNDLFEKEAVNEQEARDFAESIEAVFALISCKNGEGIDELFERLAFMFVKNQSNIVREYYNNERRNSIVINENSIQRNNKLNNGNICC